jgi:hypothetical protein
MMRTIRLLIDWPINGLRMKRWIVEKDDRIAAALVRQGFAEYVLDGTLPPPDQLEWARSIVRQPKY